MFTVNSTTKYNEMYFIMDVLHICTSYINFHRVHFHTFKFMQIQEAEHKFNSRTKYHKGYFILCFCIVALRTQPLRL